MHQPGCGLPLSLDTTARRDRTVKQVNATDFSWIACRVLDCDVPRRTVGRLAAHSEVTTDVDERAARAGRHEFSSHDVGGEAFADTAGVESNPERQRDAVQSRIEFDTRTSGCGLRRLEHPSARMRGDEREVTVVSGAAKGGGNCRVEEAVCFAPALDREFNQFERVGRDNDGPARMTVQLRDLACRPKAAPATFELREARPADIDKVITPDDEHVRRRAHDGHTGFEHLQLGLLTVTGGATVGGGFGAAVTGTGGVVTGGGVAGATGAATGTGAGGGAAIGAGATAAGAAGTIARGGAGRRDGCGARTAVFGVATSAGTRGSVVTDRLGCARTGCFAADLTAGPVPIGTGATCAALAASIPASPIVADAETPARNTREPAAA